MNEPMGGNSNVRKFYLPGPNGRLQMFYRLTETTFSDGTKGISLSYFSPDFQTWRGSDERDVHEFIKTRLVAISK
jgi:hypothetical protein